MTWGWETNMQPGKRYPVTGPSHRQRLRPVDYADPLEGAILSPYTQLSPASSGLPPSEPFPGSLATQASPRPLQASLILWCAGFPSILLHTCFQLLDPRPQLLCPLQARLELRWGDL